MSYLPFVVLKYFTARFVKVEYVDAKKCFYFTCTTVQLELKQIFGRFVLPREYDHFKENKCIEC